MKVVAVPEGVPDRILQELACVSLDERKLAPKGATSSYGRELLKNGSFELVESIKLLETDDHLVFYETIGTGKISVSANEDYKSSQLMAHEAAQERAGHESAIHSWTVSPPPRGRGGSKSAQPQEQMPNRLATTLELLKGRLLPCLAWHTRAYASRTATWVAAWALASSSAAVDWQGCQELPSWFIAGVGLSSHASLVRISAHFLMEVISPLLTTTSTWVECTFAARIAPLSAFDDLRSSMADTVVFP